LAPLTKPIAQSLIVVPASNFLICLRSNDCWDWIGYAGGSCFSANAYFRFALVETAGCCAQRVKDCPARKVTFAGSTHIWSWRDWGFGFAHIVVVVAVGCRELIANA